MIFGLGRVGGLIYVVLIGKRGEAIVGEQRALLLWVVYCRENDVGFAGYDLEEMQNNGTNSDDDVSIVLCKRWTILGC